MFLSISNQVKMHLLRSCDNAPFTRIVHISQKRKPPPVKHITRKQIEERLKLLPKGESQDQIDTRDSSSMLLTSIGKKDMCLLPA